MKFVPIVALVLAVGAGGVIIDWAAQMNYNMYTRGMSFWEADRHADRQEMLGAGIIAAGVTSFLIEGAVPIFLGLGGATLMKFGMMSNNSACFSWGMSWQNAAIEWNIYWHSAEPRYWGYDPKYGHKWSDGGYKYGRLSPDKVRELKRIAEESGEPISVVGGWAETQQGVKNRVAAYEKYGKGNPASEYGLGKVQYGPEGNYRDLRWRNTGAPQSGLPGAKADLDIWTARNQGRLTAPSQDVQQQLKQVFGVNKIDNYNKRWGYGPPPGAITFNPDGTVTRNLAPWQVAKPSP